MRFAVKKCLDLISNPMGSHLESHSVKDTFYSLAIQIAGNADILNAMEIILFEGKIFLKKLHFHIGYFSAKIGKITGYDRSNFLVHDFLQSRIYPDDQSESIFQSATSFKMGKEF